MLNFVMLVILLILVRLFFVRKSCFICEFSCGLCWNVWVMLVSGFNVMIVILLGCIWIIFEMIFLDGWGWWKVDVFKLRLVSLLLLCVDCVLMVGVFLVGDVVLIWGRCGGFNCLINFCKLMLVWVVEMYFLIVVIVMIFKFGLNRVR